MSFIQSSAVFITCCVSTIFCSATQAFQTDGYAPVPPAITTPDLVNSSRIGKLEFDEFLQLMIVDLPEAEELPETEALPETETMSAAEPPASIGLLARLKRKLKHLFGG